MKSKYAVFAVALLLTLSSTSIALATTSPVLLKGQIDTHGPRVASVTYTVEGSDTVAATDMSSGAINVYDLSFGVAAYTSLTSATVATGIYPAYALDGIYFNMLRPVANTSAFHRAISEMWNASQFQSTYLEGIAGIASPAILPCTTFAASCDNTNYIASHSTYFPSAATPAELQAAANSLHSAGLVACVGVTPVATPYTFPGGAHPVNGSTSWKVGTCAGSVYNPNWVYRTSLGRHFFSDYITANAAKIGFVFNIQGTGRIAYARVHVFAASAGAVLSDGTYVAGKPGLAPCNGANVTSPSCFGQKGYNTAPVYNYTDAISGNDQWDMYSYGYSSSQNTLFPMNAFNDEFGSSDTNPTNVHSQVLDFWSNAGVYAKTAGAAATAGRKVALYQLDQLPMLNVYYENTLWGALINGWSGYAGIPGYGPDTSSGLGYTNLNAAATCYMKTNKVPQSPQVCNNGGNLVVGLGDLPDASGGLNPMWGATTVYDNDIWLNIYDSPLSTPPTGFTAPLKFINWMTTSYKVTSFTGLTPVGPGAFNGFQTCSPCNIVKGAIYTFNFAPNVFFSDHVQATAYDYNYSLYASGLSAPPTLPDELTPFFGLMAGPSGLFATYINPATPLTIQVYVNSTAAWNILNLQVPVMPAHIFQTYFNADQVFSGDTIDTAVTPATAIAHNVNYTSGKPAAPSWLLALPNLAEGTGPFFLRTTDELSGATQILANPNYYRAFWQIWAYNSTNSHSSILKGGTYIANVSVYDWQFNSTACVAGDHICKVPGTTANGFAFDLVHANWAVLNKAGHVLQTGAVTCTGGVCSSSGINTSTLPKGATEVVFTIPYTYMGLSRVWYEQYGFTIK